MYEMQVADLLLMEDHIRYSHRPTWEAARILSVFQVAPHSKKKLKIEELFPLPWDKDQKATDGEMMKMMQHMQNLGAIMSQKMNQQI